MRNAPLLLLVLLVLTIVVQASVPLSFLGQTNTPSSVLTEFQTAAISAAAATANQEIIAAPGAGKQIWVYGWQGTADTGDGSIAWQDEDDTAESGVMEVSQRGGFSVTPAGHYGMPLMKVAANKALELDTVTCGFKGTIQYLIVE